jgi:pilus assembly protein Flp/PilA
LIGTHVFAVPNGLLSCVEVNMTAILKLIRNHRGATAIEYGLIAALIAVAAIGAMQGIGNKLNTTFNNVSNNLG